MPLLPYLGITPVVGDGLELDAEGFVIGKVTLGAGVRIGARTVLRADQDTITVGDRVRFGQAISVHMDPTFPTRIGSDVVVEDDAIVHGCTLGDAVLVERDATILTGSSVGEGSIVQAGTLVPEGKAFPARSVIAGTPGKVIRETTDDEVAEIRRRATARP
ncbi:MAG: gamma carbonic anhydrase family protein [Chloroflexi bacterium]|nr:gamma carbonic anhydrase family protein [Chloroflexota bacterium]